MTKQSHYNVGIYVRLSQEDERAGESISIENQKKVKNNSNIQKIRNKTQKICRICRISRLKLCISPNKNLENVSILRKNNRLCLQNSYRLVYFMAVKREK